MLNIKNSTDIEWVYFRVVFLCYKTQPKNKTDFFNFFNLFGRFFPRSDTSGKAAVCLEYIQCSIAQVKCTYLVLARPSFSGMYQASAWENFMVEFFRYPCACLRQQAKEGAPFGFQNNYNICTFNKVLLTMHRCAIFWKYKVFDL